MQMWLKFFTALEALSVLTFITFVMLFSKQTFWIEHLSKPTILTVCAIFVLLIFASHLLVRRLKEIGGDASRNL